MRAKINLLPIVWLVSGAAVLNYCVSGYDVVQDVSSGISESQQNTAIQDMWSRMRYILAHPDLDQKTKLLVYDGVVELGMTREQVEAARPDLRRFSEPLVLTAE